MGSEKTLATELQRELQKQWAETAVVVESLEPFGDGHSAHTYLVVLWRDGVRATYVLRLSPPGARIAGPADIGRQARVMIALGKAGVAVPMVHAYTSAPAVDGRSFALMDRVEGGRWEHAAALRSHREIAEAAVGMLRRVQSVPLQRSGIAEDTVVTPRAELRRWARLLGRAPEPLRTRAAPLHDALDATAPAPTVAPVVVHGDYHYGNLLFRDGRVEAVLDWEIASLGEPLLDLACLVVAWMRHRYEPEPNPTGGVAIDADELFRIFGAAPADGAWHVALTCFKYSAILGYNFELHRTGKRLDPIYDELQNTMYGLLDDGARVLHEGLHGY
jgi:aminoglycoside phosphotransferase (APT) family kinase protein